jgi:hypothetical protein
MLPEAIPVGFMRSALGSRGWSRVLLTYTYIYGTGQRSYKGAYYMDFALRKVAQLEVEAIN